MTSGEGAGTRLHELAKKKSKDRKLAIDHAIQEKEQIFNSYSFQPKLVTRRSSMSDLSQNMAGVPSENHSLNKENPHFNHQRKRSV